MFSLYKKYIINYIVTVKILKPVPPLIQSLFAAFRIASSGKSQIDTAIDKLSGISISCDTSLRIVENFTLLEYSIRKYEGVKLYK